MPPAAKKKTKKQQADAEDAEDAEDQQDQGDDEDTENEDDNDDDEATAKEKAFRKLLASRRKKLCQQLAISSSGATQTARDTENCIWASRLQPR